MKDDESPCSVSHDHSTLHPRQNALCRAAIPQAGNLLTRMGANCPASVPSLLLGCVEAYSLAISHGSASIANVAKKGATALAKLSRMECSRVQNKLMSLGVMLDVQLKLAMETDETAAACLLVENLADTENFPAASTSGTQGKEKDSTNETGSSSRQKLEQTTGDKPSDFRTRSNSTSIGKEPLLWQLLTSDMTLYKQALDFFVAFFSSLSTSAAKNVPIGKLCLLLRAFGWFLFVPVKQNTKIKPSVYFFETIFPALGSLFGRLKKMVPQDDELQAKSPLDDALALLQCTFMLTSARILSSGGNTEEVTKKVKGMMEIMHGFPSVSLTSDGSRFILKCAANNGNTLGIYIHIINVFSTIETQDADLSKCFFPPIQSGFEALCELVKDDAVQVIPDDNVNIIANLSSLLLEIRESAGYNEDSTIAKTKEMLRLIITDNQMNLSSLIRNEEVARFVADATVFLSVKGQLQIPLVLPTELELLGSKLLSNLRDEFRLPNDLEIRFLLQLLHVFEYLDQEPKSPFAFDPRTSPIKEALYMSKAISGWKRHFLDLRLQDHVLKHCPEIFSQAQRLELPTGEVTWALFHSMTRREVMDSLHATIRSFAESWQPDEADYSIEGIFLQAKARLSDADLCSTVVSSLLTSPHKPSPSYTYPLLCRDPLILFKCPVKVWKCKGLRRIVLAILCSLLDSNAEIIRSSSPLDDSSEELIAARNAMVVRCLLVAMSGVDGGVSGSYCSMTISVIRSLVSENYGLVALLIKQSLPEKALDWLVEFVPETMNDSRELLQMLSARSSLTTAERLVAADAVLRIAIVHGHSKEMEAATMAYTALAQLIDSFFLVVGPVGVPVNALMADDSGLDVTQISRKAAFRILRSLLRVRGRRARLRQECSMALQKLVTLCKGESAVAGVAGAVAGRRKTFLKEIFDAAVKASNAMGCTLGSQSAAA